MLLRPPRQGPAGLVHPGVVDGRGRIGGLDARVLQQLARQIEPPQAGVLVQVAKDVGQLQRPAQMMGELLWILVRRGLLG